MTPDLTILTADAVLLLHVAFVLFVIVGQVLILIGWWRAWSWTRDITWRVVHLIAIVFVTLESWCGIVCPLTTFESWLRLRAGMAPYQGGFISDWLQKLLYYSAPAWVFTVVYSMFALVVAVTFIMYPPRSNLGCKRESNDTKQLL